MAAEERREGEATSWTLRRPWQPDKTPNPGLVSSPGSVAAEPILFRVYAIGTATWYHRKQCLVPVVSTAGPCILSLLHVSPRMAWGRKSYPPSQLLLVKPQLASCSRNLVRDKEKQVRGRSYKAKGANRMTGTALAAIGLGPPWTDRARLWVRAMRVPTRLENSSAVWVCDRRKAPLQKLTS